MNYVTGFFLKEVSLVFAYITIVDYEVSTSILYYSNNIMLTDKSYLHRAL